MVLQESQTDELAARAAASLAPEQDAFLGEWVRVCVRAVPKRTTAGTKPLLSHRTMQDDYVDISTFSAYVAALVSPLPVTCCALLHPLHQFSICTTLWVCASTTNRQACDVLPTFPGTSHARRPRTS